MRERRPTVTDLVSVATESGPIALTTILGHPRGRT